MGGRAAHGGQNRPAGVPQNSRTARPPLPPVLPVIAFCMGSVRLRGLFSPPQLPWRVPCRRSTVLGVVHKPQNLHSWQRLALQLLLGRPQNPAEVNGARPPPCHRASAWDPLTTWDLKRDHRGSPLSAACSSPIHREACVSETAGAAWGGRNLFGSAADARVQGRRKGSFSTLLLPVLLMRWPRCRPGSNGGSRTARGPARFRHQ